MFESRGTGVCRVRVAVILAALVLLLAHGPAGAVQLQPGQEAFDFTVPTLSGEGVSLHDYRGEVVMVVFWASWSPRCREEMEFLKGAQERYPAMRLLAVNAESDGSLERNAALAGRTAQEWKMPFLVGLDEGLRVWDLYKVAALPTTLIIGPDGKLLFARASFSLQTPDDIDDVLRTAFTPPASPEVALGGK